MGRGKKKVLIVGAGLAGLAMYLALDKGKFDVEIIERKKKFKRLGYALIFMPFGVRALQVLGFTRSQIRSLGRNIQESYLKDKTGKLIHATNFRPLIKKFGAYMMVTRERLYRLLESRIPAENISFGVSIKSLTHASRGVYVKFAESKGAKNYDLVVGADGIHSSVRKFLFPRADPKPSGLSLIWAWIPRKENIYPEQSGALGGVKAGVGFFNSGERGRSCMAFFLQTKDILRNINPSGYRKLLRNHLKNFGDIVPKILKYLPPGNEMYLHGDYEVNLRRWYRGNIVLMGDAAHARSVFSGAGSALALEDAVVLGRHLNRERDVETAIRKYFKKQHDRVERLAMSKLRLYLQNQRGVTKYLGNFFASSLLYFKQ